MRKLLAVSIAVLCAAEAFSQTTFIKHPANPVIEAKNGFSTDPAVIYDATAKLYKMWYTAKVNDHFAVFYAVSENGTAWDDDPINPVFSPDSLSDWDGGHVRSSAVIYNGSEYLLYYMGSTNAFDDQIGLAVSSDGIHWQKAQPDPVIARGDSGAWDAMRVYHPEVLFDGSIYRMWYAGYDGKNMRIGLATSTDGKTWQKYAKNPVLDLGEPGAWDDFGVWPNGGSLYRDGTFYLYYSASSSEEPGIGRLGLAVSSDGIHWTRAPENPILSEGSSAHWDQNGLGPATVISDGQSYKMWYSAHTYRTRGWAIGFASSGPFGPAGTALLFGGIDDVLTIPEDGPVFDLVDFTIEAWIYRMEENSYSVILAKGGQGENPNMDTNFALDITPQNVARVLYETSESQNFEVIGTTPIEREQWYHIAGVYSGGDSTLALYVNGRLDAPVLKTTGSPNHNDLPVLIGHNGFGFPADHHFRGIIDEVRIWKKALPAATLRTWMRVRIPSPEQFARFGLVGYFPLDEGAGQWVANQVRPGNGGFLGNQSIREPLDPEWVQSSLPLKATASSWYMENQEVDFGLVQVDSSVTQTVRIFNLSRTDTLIASNFSVDHPHFSLGHLTDPMLIPPEQEAFFTIKYSPTRISADTATVQFLINGTSKVEVQVRGRSFRLQKAPVIASIADVPFDEGGFLQVKWQMSLHELPGYPPQAVHYTLWRRSSSDGAGTSNQGFTTAGWDSVAGIPVAGRQFYSAVAPSLGDSTAFGAPPFTVLRVSVRLTNGDELFSEPDSGYSLDNLAPQPPTGFTLYVMKNGAVLDWEDNPETDLLQYNIYRGSELDFDPVPENRIGSSTISAFTDTSAAPGHAWHYRVTAVDHAGNESPPSQRITAFVTRAPESPGTVPREFALQQNYPNPFNPATTIAFAAPRRSRIVLEIFTLQGRRIALLMDREMPPGNHHIRWQARVPSGMYFYVMHAYDPQSGEILFRQSKKMVVMK